ncbi:MAG TPA: universal stress protein [Thermoanaerobaculia bacterium]|nr:universal stress protein [Thermoanaerobaculia bacterium]
MEPSRPKLILVPTDLSGPAAHALRYASALGERFGAHLLILYADPFVQPFDLSSAAAQFTITEEMIEQAREELQRHAELNVSPRVPFDTRVMTESPLDAIIEQACQSGAGLIVMGTHGRTGLRRLLVGSVTEAVMRMATVPVLAVNETASCSATIARVLCPVTFTAASREALRQAAALTVEERAPLVLVRGKQDQDLQTMVREMVELHEWAPADLATRCEVKVIPSEGSAELILAFARDAKADLIAIGIPENRGLVDVLRGTFAERVVQQSGCPVLTVNVAAARALAPHPFPVAVAQGA